MLRPAWPPGYKTFSCFSQLILKFQLKHLKKKIFLAFKLSAVAFIVLINVRMPTIVGILTFISMINFMLG